MPHVGLVFNDKIDLSVQKHKIHPHGETVSYEYEHFWNHGVNFSFQRYGTRPGRWD